MLISDIGIPYELHRPGNTTLSLGGILPELKPSVTITAAKPCALVFAVAPEVEITRTYDDFHPFNEQVSEILTRLCSRLGQTSEIDFVISNMLFVCSKNQVGLPQRQTS